MANNRSIPPTGVFISPLVTKLVGRRDELDIIRDAVQDKVNSYLIYISGRGGIGKSHLMRSVLEELGEREELLVMEHLIDLYHAPHRTPLGLAEAISKAFGEDKISLFADYSQASDKLDQLQIISTENREKIYEQRENTLQALVEDLNNIAQKRRLVLTLDSIEYLYYSHERVGEELGLEMSCPCVYDWLLTTLLPQIENAVILAAGRPVPEDFQTALVKTEKKYHSLELEGLSEEESLTYFTAVAKSARENRLEEIAERVESLSEEHRRAIFWGLCQGSEEKAYKVRPILLALAISYQAFAGKPLPELDADWQVLKTASNTRRQEIQEKLNRGLVDTLQEDSDNLSKTLKALAYTRKGAIPELIALIADLDVQKVQDALKTLRKKLVFVKIREEGERVFLHDEMYDLLQRHVLDRIPVRKKDRYDKIRDYYRKQRKRKQKLIEEEFKGTSPGELPDSQEMRSLRQKLRDVLVEDLHYRLRADLQEGFSAFCRYAEEAILSADEELMAQLRAELLSVLSHLGKYAEWVSDKKNLIEVEKLRKNMVEPALAIQLVKRFVERSQFQRAKEAADKVRKGGYIRLGSVFKDELDVWESQALIELGESSQAESLLKGVLANTNALEGTVVGKMVLARAYNNLGYSRRVAGQHYGAAQLYKQDLPLCREVKIEEEHANTLNNCAFAYAFLGKSDCSIPMAEDALSLRIAMGQYLPVVYSLNTLSLIHVKDGNPSKGLGYSNQAFEMAKAAGSDRVLGLVRIARSEAYRRLSDEEDLLIAGSALDKEERLEKAVKHAQAAVTIFSEKVPEPHRLVEAYIELGCAYRDWAKLIRGEKPTRESIRGKVEELAQKGEEALRQATQIAEEASIAYQQVDALGNIAWLQYYLLEDNEAEKICQRILKPGNLIPADYFIVPVKVLGEGELRGGVTNVRGRIKGSLAVLPYTIQVGKAHLLLGQIAFNDFEKKRELKYLEKAIEDYALSLEYDNLASEAVFRDMRRGMTRIYERMKTLNSQELLRSGESLGDVERKYDIDPPSRLREFLQDIGLFVG